MDRRRVASYYIDNDVIDMIAELAEKEDRTKSAIIERAIRLYMTGNKDETHIE
jgi:predicted transcriptional regulator